MFLVATFWYQKPMRVASQPRTRLKLLATLLLSRSYLRKFKPKYLSIVTHRSEKYKEILMTLKSFKEWTNENGHHHDAKIEADTKYIWESTSAAKMPFEFIKAAKSSDEHLRKSRRLLQKLASNQDGRSQDATWAKALELLVMGLLDRNKMTKQLGNLLSNDAKRTSR